MASGSVTTLTAGATMGVGVSCFWALAEQGKTANVTRVSANPFNRGCCRVVIGGPCR